MKKGSLFRYLVILMTVLVMGMLAAWTLLPMVNAKYYWEKSVLHTMNELFHVSRGRVNREEPYRQYLKVIVEEAKVDGRSILILPGSFGMAFTKDTDYRKGNVAGSLEAYFMGSMRQGLTYQGNRQELQFKLPFLGNDTGVVSQDTLNQALGIHLGGKSQEKSALWDSPKEFLYQNKDETVIGIQVPSSQIKELLQLCEAELRHDQTKEETVTLRCHINKHMELTKLEVSDVLSICLNQVTRDGLIELEVVSCLGKERLEIKANMSGSALDGGYQYQILELSVRYYDREHSYEADMSGLYAESQLKEPVAGRTPVDAELMDLEHLETLKAQFVKAVAELGFEK